MEKPKSLKKEVYDLVFMKIFKNEFPVDDILKEKELAAMFSVSRAPVREALIELCNENVLRNIPRAGYQIIRLIHKDIQNATEIRKILELTAAERSFNNIKKEDIAFLEKEFPPQIKPDELDKIYAWYTNNINFHLYLCSFANNDLMSAMLEKMLIILWRGFSQNYQSGYPFSNKQKYTHNKIIQSLKDGDKKLFLKELESDITAMFESYATLNL